MENNGSTIGGTSSPSCVTPVNQIHLTSSSISCIVHMHTMPRPIKRRQCAQYNGDLVFKPRSVPMMELETVQLSRSELETLRLCDLNGFDQEQAGENMGISRGTVQRLLKSARAKVVEAIVGSKALVIAKGEPYEDLSSN